MSKIFLTVYRRETLVFREMHNFFLQIWHRVDIVPRRRSGIALDILCRKVIEEEIVFNENLVPSTIVERI